MPQRETVPDSVVRAAEQVELVDMTPEALRRRMAHGNIYKPDKVDAALGNYFRPGNLTALRELALLWLADSVDEGLQRYREQHGIATHLGDPRTGRRRADRRPRGRDADPPRRPGSRRARPAVSCWPCTSLAATAWPDPASPSSTQQRLLVESLGGSYHSVIGDDVADRDPRLRPRQATPPRSSSAPAGATRSSAALTGPGTGMRITRASGSIDVHVVSHDYIGKGRVLPHAGRAA